MAEVNINLKCDLQHAVKVQYLDGNLFSQDAAANTINIEVTDNGAPATIGGTVSANVIRPDGGTVAVTGGTISGNIVSITLPAACYALVGMISVIVKLTSDSTETTIAALTAYVYQSSTDTVVDPGTVISSIQDLIDAIETAVASIPADYSSLWTKLAPAFSSSTAYTAGQYVTYNSGLYRFTKAHAAGSWASGDVVAVNIGGELSDVKSALDWYCDTNIFTDATWTQGYYTSLSTFGTETITTHANMICTQITLANQANRVQIFIDDGKKFTCGLFAEDGTSISYKSSWQTANWDYISNTPIKYVRLNFNNGSAISAYNGNVRGYVDGNTSLESIAQNVSALRSYVDETKVAKAQGQENIGEYLSVGIDGNVENKFLDNTGNVSFLCRTNILMYQHEITVAGSAYTKREIDFTGVDVTSKYSLIIGSRESLNSNYVYIYAYNGDTQLGSVSSNNGNNNTKLTIDLSNYPTCDRLTVSLSPAGASALPARGAKYHEVYFIKGTEIFRQLLPNVETNFVYTQPMFYANMMPPKTRIIGHRGYMYSAPENSLPSFEIGGEAGVWAMETDVQNTSDGYLVIMHDDTVDRTTNGTGTVNELTYSYIRSLHIDTGSHVESFPADELIVPNLDEYLTICKKYGCLAFIELKKFSNNSYIKDVIDKVYMHGMQDATAFISSNAGYLLTAMEYNHRIHTIFLFGSSLSEDDIAKFEIGNRYGYNSSAAIKKDYLSAELTRQIHANGGTVMMWGDTHLTDSDLATAKEYGVDMFSTELGE